MARPTGFGTELAAKICERICHGESLRAICRDDEMPSSSMVFRWLADNEAFREQYARAREAQADALVEECLEIADDGSNDWMERTGKTGENLGWQLNGEHVNRSKLRCEQRRWWAGRIAPKKYGEKVQLAGDAENPVHHKHEGLAPELSAEQWLALAHPKK